LFLAICGVELSASGAAAAAAIHVCIRCGAGVWRASPRAIDRRGATRQTYKQTLSLVLAVSHQNYSKHLIMSEFAPLPHPVNC